MQTRRELVASFAALGALCVSKSARSQAWPQKPVKIIVPYGAGGNSDLVARIVAQRLGETFGQQFVVENRVGAAGALAAEAVARASADGHTLFMATLPQITILPALTKVPYDPVSDFSPISIIGTNPYVLVVYPGMPVGTLAEFVSYARHHPNKLNYAAAGVGSLTHLAAALFLSRAGLDMAPVMYKGGGATAVTDLIAGHVPVYFTNLSDVVQYAASGAVRPLAVSSETRAPQIPNVPTFIESGFPGFKIINWVGLMAPAGTPKEIIERIAGQVAGAMKDAKFAERLASNGVDPVGNSPDEFAAQIAADIVLWAEAVKIAGVQEK
jgi:tripartite-type tricarboxylate transporter receptor subunit TctC